VKSSVKPTYEFRQSDLSAFETCPEQVRRNYWDPQAEVNTSAQVRGIICHEAVEHVGSMILGGHEPSVDDLIAQSKESTIDWFGVVTRWDQKPERVEADIKANLGVWWEVVRPQLTVPTAVEKTFRHLLYENDSHRAVLTGTPDWNDAELGVCDWKFPGRLPDPKKDWEFRRWDIQSTVYTWAAAQDDGGGDQATRPFHRIHISEGDVHWVTIQRGGEHWLALHDKVAALCELAEADLDHWPQNWEGWKCSPKWCDHWANCRGAYLGDNPW
jgi:hypothetical protein